MPSSVRWKTEEETLGVVVAPIAPGDRARRGGRGDVLRRRGVASHPPRAALHDPDGDRRGASARDRLKDQFLQNVNHRAADAADVDRGWTDLLEEETVGEETLRAG